MSAPSMPVTTPRGQPCCLILIESYTGKLEAVYLPILDNASPEAFMAAQAWAYRTHVPNAKRLFYRCVLFKKTAITSLPTIAAAAEEPLVFVTGYARDTILTDALRKPSILRGADCAGFWKQYESVVVDTEHNEHPKAAVLIHLEDDPVATRVFRIMGSAISLAAAIAAHFVL
ncbi:hypothetical protein F4803DRAFT_548668 [Xylaria telfairii]|nr:hypothetical protein F4803DRAFT_548668 [Xylaria telfairii]